MTDLPLVTASSDLKLNPHMHALFLDGGYAGEDFVALGHLRGSEVAEVLAKAKRRIERVLARAAARIDDDSELALLASVSGRVGISSVLFVRPRTHRPAPHAERTPSR